MVKCQKSNVYRIVHLWNMQIENAKIETLSVNLFINQFKERYNYGVL